jgi:hypothetical protein
MTIDERVAAGATWLDANRPGWWQRINLDTLDLGDECKCILGQEHGDYFRAPLCGDIDDDQRDRVAAEMGMFSMAEVEGHPNGGEYSALTAAWRTLIQARRNAEDPWAHWADEPDADPAPAAWPDRTHDGQRMRDTETANVHGRVL